MVNLINILSFDSMQNCNGIDRSGKAFLVYFVFDSLFFTTCGVFGDSVCFY